MKGQGGQLFNKGHFFNKYIFPIYTHSFEYIYARQGSCDALVIYVYISYKIVCPTSVRLFPTFEAG